MQTKPRSSAAVSANSQTEFHPSTTERPSPNRSDAHRRCPDCDTTIKIVDVIEAVCPECKVVVSEEPISTLPQPRYDCDGNNSKARTGSRLTHLYADRGLGAGITTNVIKDENGTLLSDTQRRVARQKPWTTHRTQKETRLDAALSEIRRMGKKQDIPNVELEYAARLYRKAHTEGLVTGRSVNGFATACLLAAVRTSSLRLPVSLAELKDVSRATEDQIKTARGVLEIRMELKIPPLKPRDLVPKVTSELGIATIVERCARTLLKAYRTDEDASCRGFSPRTLAGAALHAAYDIVECDGRPTLSELSDVLHVSGSTISQRKSHLLQYREAWK